MPESPNGHRTWPHTADVIIEAWAATRDACITEAVAGLVETFVDISQARTTATRPFRIPVSTDAAALVTVLEEALYILDMSGQVPISTSVSGIDEGVIEGSFALADAAHLDLKGSVPKGISLSGLIFTKSGGRWNCRFTVDV